MSSLGRRILHVLAGIWGLLEALVWGSTFELAILVTATLTVGGLIVATLMGPLAPLVAFVRVSLAALAVVVAFYLGARFRSR